MAENLLEEAEWSDDDPFEAAEEGIDFPQILRGLDESGGSGDRRETQSGGSPLRHPSNTSRGAQREQSSNLRAASSNSPYRREGAAGDVGAVGGATVSAHAAKSGPAITQCQSKNVEYYYFLLLIF